MARGSDQPVRWAAAGGVVVGVALAGVLAVAAGGSGGGPTAPPGTATARDPGALAPIVASEAAAADFMAAWRRAEAGAWVVESVHEEFVGTDVVRSSTGRTVQRPPDRLVSDDGGVRGVLGGRRVACATGPDGTPRCRDGGPVGPGAGPGDQGEVVAGYVGGRAPLYAVGGDGPGCFALRQLVTYPDPPFGRGGRFCFDAATGAPTRREVVRDEPSGRRVSRATTVAVRDVTDADLVLPAPLDG